MIFNTHYSLAGTHAFLSASKPHWIKYDEDKLARVFTAAKAAQRGTELHALAHDLIRLGVKLPRTRTTLNMYVNDALGFRMTSEQILFYSVNCYGTADAISFRANKLRISDLKTGVSQTSSHQLEVYTALFCLEYKMNPFDIEIELRIYQNDDVREFIPDPDDIFHIMEKIKAFDKLIDLFEEEARL
jgi:hypothetical protein